MLSTSRPALIVARHEAINDADRVKLDVKEGRRILLEIKPGMPLGAFKDELLIETDHPLRPLEKITIVGKTTGPHQRAPRTVADQGTTSARERLKT